MPSAVISPLTSNNAIPSERVTVNNDLRAAHDHAWQLQAICYTRTINHQPKVTTMSSARPSARMTETQLNQLKLNYAEMIVEGMDMDSLITFALESIEKNIKDWDEDDVKSEILDYYDEETLEGLMPN